MVEAYKQRYKQMHTSLITFNYNNLNIRTQVDTNGEVFFCANDICAALGYTNPRKAISDHVSEEDVTKRDTLTNGGNQVMAYINESGLYALIFGSKLETAKQFKHWVTSEVLPSIRKTGKYETKVKQELSLKDGFDFACTILEKAGLESIQLALALDKYVINQTGESVLKKTGVQLKDPNQVDYFSPTELGKPYGLSAQKVNKLLEQHGLQEHTEQGWRPTDEGKAYGATLMCVNKAHTNGTPVLHLKWPANIMNLII